jgi:hypothetical protein
MGCDVKNYDNKQDTNAYLRHQTPLFYHVMISVLNTLYFHLKKKCFINLPKMRDKNRGQISTEYLIVIGFVTFLIIGLLGVAFYYVGGIRDKIKENQLEGFAQKVISGAEIVYYAGEPSKLTIKAYLPSGVNEVQVLPKEIVFNLSKDTGTDLISFRSNVNLTGSLSNGEGLKRIILKAQSESTFVEEG